MMLALEILVGWVALSFVSVVPLVLPPLPRRFKQHDEWIRERRTP